MNTNEGTGYSQLTLEIWKRQGPLL